MLFGNAVIPAGWQQKVLTAAGRCLSESDDIAGFFHKMHRDRCIGQPDVPLYRIVSAGQMLAYRQNAPMCLSPDIAFGLAEIALETIAAQRASPKNKFLSAAALLMILLRYRVVDPGFLNPSNEHHQPFVARINAILEQPLDANLQNRAKLEHIFKAMRDLIAARGSPLPIYDILTSLEDSDGADQPDDESGD